MSNDVMEFIVYIIDEIANEKNRYPSDIYRLLIKTECIQNYLIPYYDVLHSMGTKAITEDVLKYISLRGVEI